MDLRTQEWSPGHRFLCSVLWWIPAVQGLIATIANYNDQRTSVPSFSLARSWTFPTPSSKNFSGTLATFTEESPHPDSISMSLATCPSGWGHRIPFPHGPLTCKDNDLWMLVLGCLFYLHLISGPQKDPKYVMQHNLPWLVFWCCTSRPGHSCWTPTQQGLAKILPWAGINCDDAKLSHLWLYPTLPHPWLILGKQVISGLGESSWAKPWLCQT